jgi:hypothetical protein
MYEQPQGLWEFGRWVNGGHWSTCEARMILSYYRLGRFESARQSMKQILKFADAFRMDNPLVDFGNNVYQPNEPINLCYDTFGPPAAMIRGLFEYQYRADGLTLTPHLPPGITALEQKFPIRFGTRQIFISTRGTGAITSVFLNGRRWKSHDFKTISLTVEKLSPTNHLEIVLAKSANDKIIVPEKEKTTGFRSAETEISLDPDLARCRDHLQLFLQNLANTGLHPIYEISHARLALETINAVTERTRLLGQERIQSLSKTSQAAANKSYSTAARRLYDGLDKIMIPNQNSDASERLKIIKAWNATPSSPVQ